LSVTAATSLINNPMEKWGKGMKGKWAKRNITAPSEVREEGQCWGQEPGTKLEGAKKEKCEKRERRTMSKKPKGRVFATVKGKS